MQKMKTIELSKFEYRSAKWGGSQPFTMCFCYPKSGPVVIKGMAEEVKKYINTKLSPCHYRIVFFKEGVTRGYWGSNIDGVYISIREYKNGHQRYNLSIFNGQKLVLEKFMRRIPLRYLKEFDNIKDGKYEKN